MYLGSHGNANVLDHLIDGFNIFRRDHPTTVARLEFVGDGPLKEELIAYAEATGAAEFIKFFDRIPRAEVIDRAAEANCLVAVMGDYASTATASA